MEELQLDSPKGAGTKVEPGGHKARRKVFVSRDGNQRQHATEPALWMLPKPQTNAGKILRAVDFPKTPSFFNFHFL